MHEASPEARSSSTDWFKERCRNKDYKNLSDFYLTSKTSPYHKPTVGFFRNQFEGKTDEEIIEIMELCDTRRSHFDPNPDPMQESVWLQPWCQEFIPATVWAKLPLEWWTRTYLLEYYKDEDLHQAFKGRSRRRWNNVEIAVRNRATDVLALSPFKEELKAEVEKLRAFLPDPVWIYDASYGQRGRKLMESKVKAALKALAQ